MKRTYIETIDVHTVAGHELALTGRLQRGQWIRCGDNRPSRYVGLSRAGVIYAVHPDPREGLRVSNERFQRSTVNFRIRQEGRS